MSEGFAWLEALEFALLIAAIIILVVIFRLPDRTSSRYRTLNGLFWLLLAGAFVINGVESSSAIKWVWFVGGAAAIVAGIASLTKSVTEKRE